MLLLALGCEPDEPKDSHGPLFDSGDTWDTPEGPLGDPSLTCQLALTCPEGVEDEPKHPCDLTITDGTGELLYDADAMVEIRGRSSADFPKPPYAIELHGQAAWLVAPHATWSYLDGNDSPSSDWTSAEFDERAWAQGPAPLGYGDDVTTTIDGGADGDHPPAAWFRTSFTVEDPARVAELELEVVRDDGARVWLNGREVVRSNLAANAGASDWATAPTQDEFETTWYDWDLDPALLVEGTNVLAVEVHQSDANSSDLRFDASLLASTGRRSPDLFGMGGEDDWILGSAYIDRVLWRNKLAYDLFAEFGDERWAAEQVFCELTKDGEYEGVYLLGEAARRDGDRIDIAADDGTGQSFIVKLVEEGGFHTTEVAYGEWQAVYPEQDEENADALAGTDAALSAWEAEVVAHDEAQWDHVDLDSMVDWVILEELFKNSDAYYLSIHLWRDAGGPLHLAPWDFDLTLGYPYTDCGATGFVWRTELPEALSDSPAFKARLVDRWAELRQGPLTDAAILAKITAYETTLGDATARNFERWPVDEIKFGWGDEDNWLCPASTWEEEHDRVLAWIPERTAWLDSYFGEY